MTNTRLLLMIAGCAILGLLVWYDNFGGGEAPARAPAVTSKIIAKPDATLSPSEFAKENPSSASNTASANAAGNINPLAKLKLDDLKGVVEKPLFAPTRQRPPVVKYTPPAAVKAAAPEVKPPMYDVLGIVLDQDNHSIALMKSQGDGSQFSVMVGDTVGGWHVEEIGKNKVKLRWTDGRELALEVFSQTPQQQQQSAPTPATPQGQGQGQRRQVPLRKR